MIEGTPLLVTLDGIGTVRTMELNSSGVFTQIASQGGFTTTVYGPEYAMVDWAVDEVIVVRGTTGSGRVMTLHNILMTQLSVSSQNTNGSTQQWRVGYNKVTPMALILDRTSDSINNRKTRVLLEDLIVENHNVPPTVPNLERIAISPDNVKIAGLAGTSVANILNLNGFNGNLTWPNSFTVDADVGRWDRTSRFLVVGKRGNDYVSVLKHSANVFSKTMDIQEIGKTVYNIAMSPYANQMAVVWLSGGVYTTKLYRRLGSFYQEIQTIANFGQLIDFSADGTIIVDCSAKKALKRNGLTGVFEANDAMVANVATGVVRQALSDHVPVLFPIVDYYQNIIDLTVDGEFDLSKIKVTLVQEGAPAYDPDAQFLADVTGVYEVTAGLWPAGGIPLVNPTIVQGGLEANFTSDNITRIIVESGIEFRYAIFHHDGRPILRHDYQQTVQVARDDKLVLTVPATGVLSYVA